MKKTLNILPLLMTLTHFTVAAEETDFRGVPPKSVETIRVLRAKNKSLVDQIEALELQAAIELSLQPQAHADEVGDLKETVAKVTTDRDKETATKRSLQRDIRALEREQVEARELVTSLLNQMSPVVMSPVVTQVAVLVLPSSALPVSGCSSQSTQGLPQQSAQSAPKLSSFQQELLPQWTAGKIGPKAWDALGGSNAGLAGAVLKAIQGWPAHYHDIYCLEKKSFKLQVDSKAQSYSYIY